VDLIDLLRSSSINEMAASIEEVSKTAINAASSASQLDHEKPDVVILDLVMKGMYGFEVLTKLRELDPAARMVVVSTGQVK
jgi:DNA-binding NarL/FixJ family response regulator